MSTGRQPTRRALIVIDMSIEQSVSLGDKADEVIGNITVLAKSDDFFDVCFDSRLWISSPEETALSTLYPQVGIAESSGASLLASLAGQGLTFVR
jgi:hypothetical protein